MATPSFAFRWSPTLAAAPLVLALVLAFGSAGPAAAAPPTPAPVPVVAAAVPVVAAGWGLNRVFHFLEGVLGERRRMIQMAVIGMCIGLYIMMRR